MEKYICTVCGYIYDEAVGDPDNGVPAGTKFVFNMSYKIMDINDTGKTDKENFEMVLKGLKLLTVDGIGGGISRGNGQVKFIIKVDGVEKNIEDIKLA